MTSILDIARHFFQDCLLGMEAFFSSIFITEIKEDVCSSDVLVESIDCNHFWVSLIRVGGFRYNTYNFIENSELCTGHNLKISFLNS